MKSLSVCDIENLSQTNNLHYISPAYHVRGFFVLLTYTMFIYLN